MSMIRLKTDAGYSPQQIYNDIHRLFMTVKVSHYKTKSFAAHSAFDRIYDDLDDLIDSITEKLIGYSAVDPENLVLGTVSPMEPAALAAQLIATGEKIEEYGNSKDYSDIENLGQEFSGAGAQLKYLSRFP